MSKSKILPKSARQNQHVDSSTIKYITNLRASIWTSINHEPVEQRHLTTGQIDDAELSSWQA